jgi:hypothetical protein
VTLADALNGVRVADVQSRVHLATLGSAEDGDVFYVIFLPLLVYRKNLAGSFGEHEFQAMGTDQWFTREQLGSPRERIVVLHNTPAHGNAEALADATEPR